VAYLEGAYLRLAHLEIANLGGAHLEGAVLIDAHLENARLIDAHLEGKPVTAHEWQRLRLWAIDFPEVLLPADLRGAYFSTATGLRAVTLGSGEYGFVRVADVRWGGVNLAVVQWTQRGTDNHRRRLNTVVLGDEWQARQPNDENGKRKNAATRLVDFEAAVRANRQLATVLRDQGLNEDADHFGYRAHVLQRAVLWRQHQWLRWFGALFLDTISGHGYRPGRSFLTYLAVVLGFADGYLLMGQSAPLSLTAREALITSVVSFHGRGFFPSSFNLANPIMDLVAIEAVFGLLIEITFIATFTNRFFAR
jgi:hypothetical protein